MGCSCCGTRYTPTGVPPYQNNGGPGGRYVIRPPVAPVQPPPVPSPSQQVTQQVYQLDQKKG